MIAYEILTPELQAKACEYIRSVTGLKLTDVEIQDPAWMLANRPDDWPTLEHLDALGEAISAAMEKDPNDLVAKAADSWRFFVPGAWDEAFNPFWAGKYDFAPYEDWRSYVEYFHEQSKRQPLGKAAAQ